MCSKKWELLWKKMHKKMEIEVSMTVTWLFHQAPLILSYSFMSVQETNIQTH